MFDVAKQLGVQSYCFRNFKTLDGLIAQVKGIGLARTEVCGVHVDFNNESTFEPAIAQFNKAGVAITSIGVQYFNGNEANEEKWFRFAKAAGAKMISASFELESTPAVYRMAEKFADKYDVVLGIHNHGGYDWLGNSKMLAHVLKNTSPRIGLCIDTAWCLQSKEDPIKWAEKFNERLYSAHIKDFVFEPTGKPQDVVIGTGNLKLPEFMKLVLKAPKLTSVTLEYEGDIENPGPKLKECVDKMRTAVAS